MENKIKKLKKRYNELVLLRIGFGGIAFLILPAIKQAFSLPDSLLWPFLFGFFLYKGIFHGRAESDRIARELETIDPPRLKD